MYGRCQHSNDCDGKVTHQVIFQGQPRSQPMKVCEDHANEHRKPGNKVKRLE